MQSIANWWLQTRRRLKVTQQWLEFPALRFKMRPQLATTQKINSTLQNKSTRHYHLLLLTTSGQLIMKSDLVANQDQLKRTISLLKPIAVEPSLLLRLNVLSSLNSLTLQLVIQSKRDFWKHHIQKHCQHILDYLNQQQTSVRHTRFVTAKCKWVARRQIIQRRL